MSDDRKRDEPVTFKVTERMLLDLGREAARADRTLSDYIFLTLRRSLYGAIGYQQDDELQPTTSDKVNPKP